MSTIDEYVSLIADHKEVTVEGSRYTLDVIGIENDEFHKLVMDEEDSYIHVKDSHVVMDYIITREMAEKFLQPCDVCWPPTERMSPIEGMAMEEPKEREPIDLVTSES